MNSEFSVYFQLGIQHIADLAAYDHILFIVALCAIYSPADWKRLLILVTAFTIGHSLTLALAALDVIQFNQSLIEFLIPVTILITALLNFVPTENVNLSLPWWKYILPLLFGFIHGMGFSNYFKSLLGKEESVLKPLFAFNLGIETGQVVIVIVLMLLAHFFVNFLRIQQTWWTRMVSGLAVGMSLYLMWETKFW
ncbi:MAG: HupE/UreJ family protein [Saprospiraceae bacterium]|nr:HupE/UreJ family protein [Saprospiraceae bacterium]